MIDHARPDSPGEVLALARAVQQRQRDREAQARAASRAEELAEQAAAEARRMERERAEAAARAAVRQQQGEALRQWMAEREDERAQRVARRERAQRAAQTGAERRAALEAAALAAFAAEPPLDGPPPAREPGRSAWVMGRAREAFGIKPAEMFLNVSWARDARVLAATALRLDGAKTETMARATGHERSVAMDYLTDGLRRAKTDPRFAARLAKLRRALEHAPPIGDIAMPALMEVVAEISGIPARLVLSRCKRDETVAARAAACVVARDVLGLSLPKIGVALRRDHTSVLHLTREAAAGRWAELCAAVTEEFRARMAGGAG